MADGNSPAGVASGSGERILEGQVLAPEGGPPRRRSKRASSRYWDADQAIFLPGGYRERRRQRAERKRKGGERRGYTRIRVQTLHYRASSRFNSEVTRRQRGALADAADSPRFDRRSLAKRMSVCYARFLHSARRKTRGRRYLGRGKPDERPFA